MLRHSAARDENGHLVGDLLSGFIITDGPTSAEMSDDIQYWLAVHPDGRWMVRKHTTTTGTERFAYGISDYDYAWSNRASLTYDRTDKIF